MTSSIFPRNGTNLNVRADRKTISARDQAMLHAMEGEREALDELFLRSRIRLYNTAFRLLGNREDAEDALQDGLLAAYRNLNTFEGRSQFSTWLTRIVVNAALMQRRRHRSSRTVSASQILLEDGQTIGEILPDPKPNPEESYAYEEQLQLVERALQGEPEVRRRAWWLCHVQGMKIREVASIMGISSGTLKSQLFRARRSVRKAIGHEGALCGSRLKKSQAPLYASRIPTTPAIQPSYFGHLTAFELGRVAASVPLERVTTRP